MKNRQNNIKVIKDAVDPETPELLAASIIRIDENLQELLDSGLTLKGLATMVASMSGSKVTQTDFLLVIDGLKRLKSYYVKK